MDTQKDPEMYAFLSLNNTPGRLIAPALSYFVSNTINTNQHLRNNDRRSHHLLGNLHALRPRRLARKLPPLRLPPCQLLRSGYAGLPVLELLEVRFPSPPLFLDI